MKSVHSRILTDKNSKEFKKLMRETELKIIHTDDVRPRQINYPRNLSTLVFEYETFRDYQYERIDFPETIVYLELDTNCPLTVFTFPERLQLLNLFGIFNQSIKNANFPQDLQYLSLGDNFDQDVRDANLPDSIVEINFGNSFNQSIRNANLPISLQRLILGNRFQKSIRNANFPQGLEEIILDENYQGNIQDGDYPELLRSITIGDEVIVTQREEEFGDQRFLRSRGLN